MIQQVSASLTGMHCASCSTRIEKVVAQITGVESCVVNLATETVNLHFDSSVVDLDIIAESIASLGFELVLPQEESEKQVDLDIKGMHCASCSTRIDKVVGELDGVVSCSVNLARRRLSG